MCALEQCKVIFTWCSMRPKQLYCSKAHYMTARHAANRPPKPEQPEGFIRCVQCGELRPKDEYAPSRQHLASSWCRSCSTAYGRQWAFDNKEKRSAATRRSRAARLLRRYGAPSDDIDELLAAQGGVCCYCDGEAGIKGFHIDHDHELHELGLPSYRGLACHGCNVGIGALGDDPTNMEAVAERLREKKAELRWTTLTAMGQA